MILFDVLKEISLDVVKRSFLVDYRDENMDYFHDVTTAVNAGAFNDREMIGAILDKLNSSGFTALTIVEVFGEYTIEQLQALVDDPVNYKEVKYKPLYIDKKEVERAVLDE